MTRLFQTTGFRSLGCLAAVTVLILWHVGLILLQPVPRLAEWLCIISLVGIAILVPATFLFSLAMRFRSAGRRFDYCAPVLALATLAVILAELAANARSFVIVGW